MSRQRKTNAYLRGCVGSNQKLRCKVAGCFQPRHQLTRWCRPHYRRANLYGHPTAVPITPKTYAREEREAEAFLTRFPSHPGLMQARAMIAAWLRAVGMGETESIPCGRHLARLVKSGITADVILRRLIAVYLLHKRRPHTFRDTDLAFSFAITRGVLSLAPFDVKKDYRRGRTQSRRYFIPNAKEHQAFGETVSTTLGVLLLNACGWLDSPTIVKVEEELEFQQAMGHRFSLGEGCPVCEARRARRRIKYRERKHRVVAAPQP